MSHAIALHGGAGTIAQELLTPELEKAYLHGLDLAISAGNKILLANGSAAEAVAAAVIELENYLLAHHQYNNNLYTKLVHIK